MSIRLSNARYSGLTGCIGMFAAVVVARNVAAQSEFRFDVPLRQVNSRFYEDRFVTHRPSLTFNGFSCTRAQTCNYGLGVVEVLEKIVGQNPDEQVLGYLNQLLDLSKKELAIGPVDRREVIENTRVVQARAAIALIWVVLEGSEIAERPSLQGLPSNAREAVQKLFDALEDLDNFRIRKSMSDDAVKWVPTVSNLARTMDLYLALENAMLYYPSNRFRSEMPALPSCQEKSSLLSFLADEVEYLDDLGNEPVLLGIKRDEIQPGNWPMKVHLAVAYGSLASQATLGDSCEPLSNHAFEHWLERGLRSAGAPTDQNRSKHWNYQTENGSRFFAEGPYYFHLTLPQVVAFWHAVRINGLLGYHPNFDLNDPFHSNWFTDPIEWLADTVTPGGSTLPFDDGNRVFMEYSDLLRWDASYGNEKLGRKFAWISDQKNSAVPNNQNMLPLYLAIPALARGEGEKPVERLGAVWDFDGPRTSEQVALMRRSTSDSMGRTIEHFVAMNGETGNATRRGEGHEQADQLQLVYYADDVGVLIDSGYDNAYGISNSTWNHYYDHNVLTIADGIQTLDGGLPPPIPSLFATRIISRHADADYLGQYSEGRIDVLRGAVDLKLMESSKGTPDARYLRYSLFVGDPQRPYLVDVNRGVSLGSEIDFTVSYHVGGVAINYRNSNYRWRSKGTDESNLETRISAIRADGNLEFSVRADSSMERLRELENITRLDLRAREPSYTFSSVALISTGDPNRPFIFPKRLATATDTSESEIDAFFWAPDRQMVDILLLSFSSRIASSISLKLADQNVDLTMDPNAEVGFIRLRNDSSGAWRVEPGYAFNITSDLNLVGTSAVAPTDIAARLQIHPNPVRGTVEIEFGIKKTGFVQLSIFDLQGRKVAILIDSIMESGPQRLSWESSSLSNGVYFLQLTRGSRRETKPLIVKQ